LDADDFHAGNRPSKQVPKILFVASKEIVCAGGDGSTEDGAVFVRKLHSEVKKLKRHQFHVCPSEAC
jgi:hypothetical protein